MEFKKVNIGEEPNDGKGDTVSKGVFIVLENTKKIMLNLGYNVESIKTKNCQNLLYNFKALNELYDILNKKELNK